MNGLSRMRYDPLYRVIDATDEMLFMEGQLRDLYFRIKNISNLGIIAEILETAKYSKYEHHIGTAHQIVCLLQCINEIPERYHKPLIISALLLHLGHFPFTYATERALLLSCNMGFDVENNARRKYVSKEIEDILSNNDYDEENISKHSKEILSMRNIQLYYKYLALGTLNAFWERLKNNMSLTEDQRLIIVNDLIDPDNYGYYLLDLADKADFVQRDALYLGTARLDISPKHLYSREKTNTAYEIADEEVLLDTNYEYLKTRFYENDEVRWFSRLYEKIVASLILFKTFDITWLYEYNDYQFKHLLVNNQTKDNKSAGLPNLWITRARNLFNREIIFEKVFSVQEISFEKTKNIVDVEYVISGKKRSERGLLTYPFETGLLLDISYMRTRSFRDPDFQDYSITLFQNTSGASIEELLRMIERMSAFCPIEGLLEIETGLGRLLSWTKEVRIDSSKVITALAKAIEIIENTESNGHVLSSFLSGITSIKSYKPFWDNFENFYFWLSPLRSFVTQGKERMKDYHVYKTLALGICAMPTKLLKYSNPRQFLTKISDTLVQLLESDDPQVEKGHLFEALWFINRITENDMQFQFLINGLVVVDFEQPKEKQDINEFDVIELLRSKEGKHECLIYACSIAPNYERDNKGQLERLATQIHSKYQELTIKTFYVIPEDVKSGDWTPRIEEAGFKWN